MDALVAVAAAVGRGANVTACCGVGLAVLSAVGAPDVAVTGLTATVGDTCARFAGGFPLMPTNKMKKNAVAAKKRLVRSLDNQKPLPLLTMMMVHKQLVMGV